MGHNAVIFIPLTGAGGVCSWAAVLWGWSTPAFPHHVHFFEGGSLSPAPQPLFPLLCGGGDVFTLSATPQVPFTYIDYESNGKLWPGIHQMFSAVERFQVVNSYGLFRRMTGVGGRPEVVLEGSYDKQSWTVSAHLAGMGEWWDGRWLEVAPSISALWFPSY